MALLPILCFPDPRLNTVAKPVAAVDARIRTLCADMIATMYDAKGIGLAATQVDVHERLIVIDVSEERDKPLVLVNPELVWTSPTTHLNEEGCLSVPDFNDDVARPRRVHVRWLDEYGKPQQQWFEDYDAVVVQHEMDHLEGTVILDKVSRLKKGRYLQKRSRQKVYAE